MKSRRRSSKILRLRRGSPDTKTISKVPSLNTTSSEGAGTASELGISSDTLGVLTAIVCGRVHEASSKLFRLDCGVLSIFLLGGLETIYLKCFEPDRLLEATCGLDFKTQTLSK